MAIDFTPQIDFEPETHNTGLQPTLEPTNNRSGKDFGMNTLKDLGSNILGTGVMAAKGVNAIMNPESMIPSVSDIKQYPDMMKELGSRAVNVASHPIDTAYKYPVSTALALAGAAEGGSEAAGVAREAMTPVGEAVAARLPKIFKFLANVPEGATDTLLEKKGDLPKVTPEATNSLIQSVKDAFEHVKTKATAPEATQAVKAAATDSAQTALEDVVREKGAALNEAKAKVGLPVSPDEKVQSLKQNDNEFGINHADLTKTDKGEPFASPSYKWPDRDNMQFYKLSGDKAAVEKLTNGEHTQFSDVSQQSIDKYKIPVKKSPYLQNFANPSDLAIAVDNFKQEAANMPQAQRVKLASLLQDRINGMVDWKGSGTSTQGILKTQYRDLQDLAIPDELQASKSGMKDALGLMKDLEGKLGGDAGKAQDFLQNLFTSKKSSAQDYMQKLAKLETESGQPILSKLAQAFKPRVGDAASVDLVDNASKHFDVDHGALEAKLQQAFTTDNPAGKDVISNLKQLEKLSGKNFVQPLKEYFASKSFSKYASRPGLEVAEIAHKPNLLGLAALLAQSPAALKQLTKLGFKMSGLVPKAIEGTAGFALPAVLNEASKRTLQSVKDRLKNKYAN